MKKDELHDLFKDQLNDLNDFEKNIKRIRDIIYLIIENFDLLKEDTTDEQIGEVSSDINIKVSKINSIIQDILSDSKKLESFINEIKLLKRKRDKKLGKKSERTSTQLERDNMLELLKKLNNPSQPLKNPYTQEPLKNPYINPNKWNIQF